MSRSILPLRYPGGKSSLLAYIEKFIESNKISVQTIIEPYAGSAAISIGLLRKNKLSRSIINDSDQMVYSFWKTVMNHNQELIEMIDSVQVSIDTWFDYRKYLIENPLKIYNEKDVAMAFLFLNRTSYSGIVKAGPLGGKRQLSKYGIDCRFNRENLKKKISNLESLSPKIELFNMDGVEFMKEMIKRDEDVMIYADPPYYGVGRNLYNHYFDDSKHIELAEYLKQIEEQPWLLSYNNNEFIVNLYSDQKKQPIYLDYHTGHYRKDIMEYMFSNKIIPTFKISEKRKKENNPSKIKNNSFEPSAEVKALKTE
ncbi:DNA adenine methylase [Cuniculiplasma sp. SKW4]|uniref:DNA adenine methylase n=1 Tax=Cuniculiplasma sp. SKW4 TaxID=3400171 RepID=UPI003FD21FE6